MIHQFRVVFQRDWNDDWEASEYVRNTVTGNRSNLPAALVAQLAAEIDEHPSFHRRFEFSNSVIVCGSTYYLLGQILWEGDSDVAKAWDAFRHAFQVAYDGCGVAGHYQIAPSPEQTALQQRLAAASHNFPVPPWTYSSPRRL